MAFVPTVKISCKNFPENWVKGLQFAIENKMVIWKNTSVFMGITVGHFTWANAEWKITEQYEVVTSLELISGNTDAECLTIAILSR